MIKRIIICAIFLVCMSASIFASFLSTQSNYYKVHSDIEGTWYFDKNSVKSVRYEPPYYAIRSDIYKEKYGDEQISKIGVLFYYDYELQVMKSRIIEFEKYDSYGNLLSSVKKDGPVGTHIYHKGETSVFDDVGNYCFYNCYHIFFYKEWNQDLGLHL